jgi:hypothetical protein
VETKSIIALGLGFNGWTNKLAESFSDDFFGVDWEKFQPLPDFESETDELIFGGTKINSGAKDGKHDYALIARIVARDSGYVQFVCAGRTANGTAAAGFFLADKWDELASLYEGFKKGKYHQVDSHSLAVIIRHRIGKPNEMDNDNSGVICREEYPPKIVKRNA